MSAKKTAAKKTSKPFSFPDGIEIYFSANLTRDQRELVEQSIATVVGRTRAEADAALARMAEVDRKWMHLLTRFSAGGGEFRHAKIMGRYAAERSLPEG